MKINIILPGPYRSGGIEVMLKYAQYFQSKGDDVVIYFSFLPFDMKIHKNYIKNKWIVIRRMLGRYYTVFLKKFLQEYRDKNLNFKVVFDISDKYIRDADVVIATAWETSYQVNRLSDIKGEKFYFVQDYELWYNPKMAKESYNLPLKKVVIAKWIEQRLVNECGEHGSIIINNGIDSNIYKNLQKRYKESNEQIVFLMLYNKQERKGMQDGIDAFRNLRRKYDNIQLILFGFSYDNEYGDEFEVVVNPSKTELIKLYSLADIFLFPSHIEGWGLPVLEAMSCKCAVVATNVGCIIDIGKDEENCMISEPRDIENFEKNMEKLLVDYNLRKKISENGRKTAEKLQWEKSYKAFHEYLQR